MYKSSRIHWCISKHLKIRLNYHIPSLYLQLLSNQSMTIAQNLLEAKLLRDATR